MLGLTLVSSAERDYPDGTTSPEARPYHFASPEHSERVHNRPEQKLGFGRMSLPDAFVWAWRETRFNEVSAFSAFNKSGDLVMVLSNDSPQAVKLDLQRLLSVVASRIGTQDTSIRVTPKIQFGFLVRKPDLISITLEGEEGQTVEVLGLLKVYRNHAIAVVGFDRTAEPSLLEAFLDSYLKTSKKNSSTGQAILTLWIGLMVVGMATVINGSSKEPALNGGLWALVFVVASMGADLWKYPAYGDPQRLSELFFAYGFVAILFVHLAISWQKRRKIHLKQQEYCFHENLQSGTSGPNKSSTEPASQSLDSSANSLNHPST